MDELDRRAFATLFTAVVEKCFGHPLDSPLSEAESRLLSNAIDENTGLVIGWRSIKNYAIYLLNPDSGRQENPSIATLDTLARYVVGAPVTTEAERKRNEDHYPYWFRYREQATPLAKPEPVETKRQDKVPVGWVIGLVGLAVAALFFVFRKPALEQFTDDFHAVDESSLQENGWSVHARNEAFWRRRGETSKRLTLFTLKGDNWHKTGEAPQIQNLLVRRVQNDCFRTEVHITDFVPSANWQQAGIVLLEDTTFTGKSIRISLSYNDFFGGYVKPGEILVQAVASYGKGYANLEEITHQPLFSLTNPGDRRLAVTNLKNFALRVEKQGQKFRFLYSASPVEDYSFKEVARYEFNITPKYVGVFALKGFVDTTAVMPVAVKFFRLDGVTCE
ncbi:hypothetical protein GCM10027341_23700 [Spirosoma knui]